MSIIREHAYSIDSTIADLTQLQHLLEATAGILREMDFGSGLNRNHELDQVMSMVSIAGDLTEAICNRTSESHLSRTAPDYPTLRKVIEINDWTAAEFRRGERSAEEIVAEAAQRLKALS